MPKSNVISPLVAAAAAIDQELREYDELAAKAKRIELDGEKALAHAARLLEDATTRQPQIQEKLRALVAEIEAARHRQQQSLDVLVEVSQALAARASDFEGLMRRFAGLGESARAVNQLTGELVTRNPDGAQKGGLLEGIRALEERMQGVVVDAEALAQDAQQGGWPEIARQADAVRQQVSSAKNKLTLAHRTVAERSPS
jgi:chromosome segregation ATPase